MRTALSTMLVVVIGALLAVEAQAAPYTVWSCRDAQGAPISTAAWNPAGNTGTRTDTCGAGGSLNVALGTTDTAPASISGYRFDIPAGVTINGYTAWLAAKKAATPSSPAPYVAGLGQGDELSVPTVLDGCYTPAPSCSFGTFSDPLSPGNATSLPVLEGGLALMAACSSATDTCDPAADPPARAALFRIAVALDDPSAPTVDPLGGTIAAGSPVSGVRTVVADVGDEGSGVRRTELLVDGAVVDRQDGPGTCTPPFTVADPCPRSTRTTFVLDAATLSEGPHAVAVRVYDAASNTADGAPLAITVDHPAAAPPQIVVTAASAPTAVRFSLPKRISLPSSKRATGTVVGTNGAPRPGVSVRFQQRPFGGTDRDWRDMRGSMVSDASGRFRIPVPSTSAQVRALASSTAFTATPAITDFVAQLKATIRASDRTLRNGQRLTLSGRLRNAGGAAEGHTIIIQSVVRGEWRSVDSVEAQDDGRITWRYRFTNTTQTARYRFRFVVPAAKRLPWTQRTTAQVSVLVRPV
jgi:hypothetical protein